MDFDGNVLFFLAIAAEPYGAETTVAKFVNNAVATLITKAIAEVDWMVATCLVVFEALDAVLGAC